MSENRTIRVTTDEKGTFTVAVVDEHGHSCDEEEEVAEEEIPEATERLKWNNFRVQDILAELTGIEFKARYLGVFEEPRDEVFGEDNYGPKTYKRARWILVVKRGERITTLSYSQGNNEIEPDRDEVLELYLDNILTLGFKASSVVDLKGLGEWAEDLGYNLMKNGVAKALEAWGKTWKARDFFMAILTGNELQNITHAFEEGRRR